MNRIIKYALFFSASLVWSQDIYTEYLVIGEDSLDVFSYQIPENYNDLNTHSLLVVFHQWGGDEITPYYTQFDEEANTRNWLYLSPFGGSSNNYNHQNAQYFVMQEIIWLSEQYNVDSNRIYMVGGSMGGAAGAIFANNHLDPTQPMVAATASASGILDCERRSYEMDGNNSMIEWFGGSPEDVPFEYHRNSAVFFADSTQSMHFNLQHTPLYLDFGISEPHRTHAEDLFVLLEGYNLNMWIDTNPTGSHGFSVFNENHVCDWMSQFELEKNPEGINVNLDEPSRAYWLEAKNQVYEDEFIRINCEQCYENTYCINQFNNSDTLIFHILNDSIPSNIQFYNYQYNTIFTIGITGTSPIISTISDVSFEGFNSAYWDNLNQDLGIIYVDISWGYYNMSFVSEDFTDVNMDGVWDVTDIVLTIQNILGQIIFNSTQIENADLNDDGNVNILDIILMVNLILS